MIIKSNTALYSKYKNISKLSTLEFKRFKKQIISLIKSNHIKTGRVKNQYIKINIDITFQGIEHSLGLRCSMAKIKSLTVIRDLVKTAMLASIEVDKKNKGLDVLIFRNQISVDGEVWNVIMYVKQGGNGKYYYHHDLSRYKKA